MSKPGEIIGSIDTKSTRRGEYSSANSRKVIQDIIRITEDIREDPLAGNIVKIVQGLENTLDSTPIEHIIRNKTKEDDMADNYQKIMKQLQYVPIFSGGRNKKGVEELKCFCEIAKELYNSGISPDQRELFLKLIVHRLKGDAHSVASRFKHKTLEDLLTNLKKYFVPIRSPTDVVGEISNTKQLPTESILEFGARLQDLVMTAKELYTTKYPEKDTSLLGEEVEGQAIKSFKKGMSNTTIRTSLLTTSVDTLQELVDTAVKLEEAYSDSRPSKVSVLEVKQYDAVCVELQELKEKMARLELRENPVLTTQLRKEPVVCSFCDNFGHVKQQCRKLYNTFCTNCRNYGHPVYECNYVENGYRNPSSANNRNYNNYNQPMENYDNFRNKQNNQPNKNNTQYTNNNEPS